MVIVGNAIDGFGDSLAVGVVGVGDTSSIFFHAHELPPVLLRSDVLEIKDLKPGMVLTGTVRNVIDFGVFVDIGVHQDGLVHISQICDRFIKHPSEVVAVGDIVKVAVLDVDEKKHRISLTMKIKDKV